MISIKPNSVPGYLKESAFFANLSEDDEEVSVPQDCCKLDTSITNTAELEELLRTLRFWGVDQIPKTVIVFMLQNPQQIKNRCDVENFTNDLPVLAQISKVANSRLENRLSCGVETNNLEIVSYLLEHLNRGSLSKEVRHADEARAMKTAARNGNHEILCILHQYNCIVVDDLVNCAFVGGNIDCLSYVHETMGCRWTNDLFCELGVDKCVTRTPFNEQGMLQCLEYAQEHGCPADPGACELCAIHNLTALLKHLHEQGSVWDEFTVTVAALNGNLSCLQYAMDHGCPMPDDIFQVAMFSGSVEIIQFLHERGLPWPEQALKDLDREDDDTLQKTAICLTYAYSLGCPRDPNTCYYASMYGWLDLLVDAHRHGCKWNEFCTMHAARHGRLECLKYLHENGCRWTSSTTTEALTHGHYDCLKYAIERGCPTTKLALEQFRVLVKNGVI